MKATHRGTCQWCNRVQLLPGGVLARHGFTLRNHWQQGRCHGSESRPFEESKDLIDDSIAHADRRLLELDRLIETALAGNPPDKPNLCWAHVYHAELSSRTRGMVRLWEQVELQPNNSQHSQFYVTEYGGRVPLPGLMSMERRVELGISARVTAIRGEQEDVEDYIVSQELRIAAWQPRPLLPLSAT